MSGPASSCTQPTPSSAARRRVARCRVRRCPGVIDSRATRRTTWWASRVSSPESLQPGLAAHLGHRRQQGGGHHRRVHVDPREIDHAAVRRAVELLAGRRPVLGPAGLVPAVPEDDAAAGPSPGGLDAAQAVGEVGGPGEVEPLQGQPGRRRVDVGVDEGRRDQGPVEVDDGVRLVDVRRPGRGPPRRSRRRGRGTRWRRGRRGCGPGRCGTAWSASRAAKASTQSVRRLSNSERTAGTVRSRASA